MVAEAFPVRGQRAESPLLVPALALAAFLIAFGALHYGFYTQKLLMDTPLYERYGDAMVHHDRVPYRDFAVEYPPGALPVFAAPSLLAPAGDFQAYARVFEGLMALCGAAAAAIAGSLLLRGGASRGRVAAAVLLAGLAPLALGPVVLSRFDLWPALLTVAAIGALSRDRTRLGLVLLGLAVAAKLYPAVLVPLALAYVWRRRGRREAVLCAVLGAAAVGACFAPFVAASPAGVWHSLAGQASRPLQIESAGAALLLAAHQLTHLPLTEVSSHGSDNLAGGLAHALATVESLAAIAALAAIWIGFARGAATRERLLRFAAAAVCAFLALNRVLSPQYLMWLFALVPLVRCRRGLAAGGLFLGAMTLTQLWFPYHYIGLVYGLDARSSWLVVARDLLLLALLATLAWPERARRTGSGVVGALVAVAAAALFAAAAGSASRSGSMHSGLLVESGVASSCGAGSRAPSLSPGAVAYSTATFRNGARRPSCVTVTLKAAPGVQLFSASYRSRFVPTDPRQSYLGDAGRCSNAAGVAGRRLVYSFDVPARSAFAVEVEDCGSTGLVPPYLLDIRTAGSPLFAYRFAGARRTGASVVARWRVTGSRPGTGFALFREEGARMARAACTPIEVAPGSYSCVETHVPLTRPARYWIAARTRDGAWSWHGPVASVG